ncbi:hypothetical protein [Tritonibacter sp. SIMBA_163]|uniref:hypothetical protein n=1 Tax=Tritonibacter sp. SIMBA_163 TaxID=3080868 RepID=UPI0039812C02
MHEITFSSRAGLPGQSETQVTVSGDAVTVDGIAYDLSAVPEGGFAEADGDLHPFRGRTARSGGVLHYCLRWRFDPATAEPAQPAALPTAVLTAGPVPDAITRLEGAA